MALSPLMSPELEAKNRETSRKEVEQWQANPPRKYFAYVSENEHHKPIEVTTWMGDSLGRVYASNAPVKQYTPTGGVSEKQFIYVRGNNGKNYHGWYYLSSGNYCRLSMAKESI